MIGSVTMSKVEIVLDENVSLALAEELRKRGYTVTAIAELEERGIDDETVWRMCTSKRAILITRDCGFTRVSRFPSSEVGAVIYLRRGNLKAEEEVALVIGFLEKHPLKEFEGHLVTLWPGGVRVHPGP